MFGQLTGISAILVISAIISLDGLEAAQLSFPGPAKGRALPLILQRQEQAPYPPAGLVPDPPFELPTEEAVEFPPPDQIYGPPADTYGPPAVEEVAEVYGPPDLTYGPPDQTYGPPEEAANDDGSNTGLPQNAAIIDLASLPLPPQAQYVLPLLNRLSAFRPQRPAVLTPQRRPAKLTARPQPKPAKIVNAVKGSSVFQSTPLALPFVDRRVPFRPARLIVNAPQRRRPVRH